VPSTIGKGRNEWVQVCGLPESLLFCRMGNKSGKKVNGADEVGGIFEESKAPHIYKSLGRPGGYRNPLRGEVVKVERAKNFIFRSGKL